MLHEVLASYLEEVERAILQCRDVYVEKYAEEVLTSERVNLRIRMRFDKGPLLEMSEAVVVEANNLVHLDYRYHCQDEQHHLIFRYDSTPHFPDLTSFPHHKHLSNDVVACEKPSIEKVLEEIVEQQ
ncbi:DUF6516 family protein [Deltaproteobacteria bacterium TL4]